jgi:putative selenium metabolism hydrolase
MFELVTEDKRRLTAFLRDLIRTPSYSCQEGAVAERIADEMRAVGFRDVAMDRIGNVVGRLSGSGHGNGPTLLFDGHMDTVGISDRSAWKHDPFGAEIENGIIYGLGACDMKGALAAMVYAGKLLVESRAPLRGDVVIACVVQEEPCEGLAARVLIEEEGVRPNWVVLGEPSSMTIARGQRGRVELQVTAYGRACHASQPDLGDNAIYSASRLIFGMELLSGNMSHDRFLGPGSLAVTQIQSESGSRNVVPDRCSFVVDRRLTLGENEAKAMAEVQSVVARERVRADVQVLEYRSTSFTGYQAAQRANFPAWVTDENHPLVQAMERAVRDELGVRPKTTQFPFSTDGTYTAGAAGIPTLGLGPGDEKLAHTADDQVRLDDVFGATRVYAAIATILLGGK